MNDRDRMLNYLYYVDNYDKVISFESFKKQYVGVSDNTIKNMCKTKCLVHKTSKR